MGANAGKDFKRGALAVLTMGTSEIKTGGGQYGDETVADSLFPKTVNDAMLDDRSNARTTTDLKKQVATQAAPTAPDATDQALSATRRAAAARLMSGQGRANSFIGGL